MKSRYFLGLIGVLFLTACTMVMPVSTPANDVTDIVDITAVPFDLGDAVLVQTGEMNETVREMPVRLNGLIAAPPTGEDLPIAIVIHGSHGSGCDSPDAVVEEWPCPEDETPHYAGFAYLVEALAERGYVAISINANPAFVMAYGEARPTMRLPILFDMYMGQIAAAVNGEDVGLGVDLAGRVDWNQLAVLGHSNGGEGVNWIVDSRADGTTPEQIEAGQGPVTATIMLAPSRTSTREIEMDIPFAVILPECDRDVSGLDGQYYYEYARTSEPRAALAASVYLAGANHNRFNSLLEDETLGRASAVCEDALLPASDQQDFLAAYVGGFFDVALGRGDGDLSALGLDPAQPAAETLYGRDVLTSLALPTTERLILPLAEGGPNGGTIAVFCSQGYGENEVERTRCRRGSVNQPGNPQQMILSWDGMDGSYDINVPESDIDWSVYQTLHMRVAMEPLSDRNTPGKAQSFSVQVTDGDGNTATAMLADEPALAFPAGEVTQIGDMEFWDNHVVLSSIRVPLTAFSGVDFGNVQSIALVFDATNSGEIFVTDLEILRTNMTNSEESKSSMAKPDYVAALESVYGPPSQEAFGSAVFYEPLAAGADLEETALSKYRFFVGDLWERFGEDAWLGEWRQVYRRPSDGTSDIVAELGALEDRATALSASMLLENVENVENAHAALAAAFDDVAVSELAVYNLGDGEAMGGVLVAGWRQDAGEAIFVALLLD